MALEIWYLQEKTDWVLSKTWHVITFTRYDIAQKKQKVS